MCEICWARVGASPLLEEHFDAAHSVSWLAAIDTYDGSMKEIVQALKYDRRRSISPRLGAMMRQRGAALLGDAGCVVPVPLHPRREYARGFNQAHDLAMHLGLPVMRSLKRVVHTPSQIDLPAEQRQANVRHAFALRGVPAASIVVLVDDVATTGATLDACARVLKLAGVREVRALTAARAVHARRR